MGLALNNLQKLIYHKTQTNKQASSIKKKGHNRSLKQANVNFTNVLTKNCLKNVPDAAEILSTY